MIRHIVRKEFTDIVRDGRFRWCSILVGALLLVSLGHGWVQARKRAAGARGRAGHRPRALGNAGARRIRIRRRTTASTRSSPAWRCPLSTRAVDPYTGTSVWLEAHRQNDFLLRPAQDATAAQRIGVLTAAQVLQHLVPLLIILLTFGAFAGEREAGARCANCWPAGSAGGSWPRARRWAQAGRWR